MHFGHKNIIKYANRYKYVQTVEEMNDVLVKNQNAPVGDCDEVLCLGDVAFANFDRLDELQGIKSLILGNHDWKNVAKLKKYFDIYERDILINKQYGFVASHYPIMDWPHKSHNYLHFHGHSHGTIIYDPRAIDVGVDCWDLAPISIITLIEEARKRISNYLGPTSLTIERTMKMLGLEEFKHRYGESYVD